MKDSLKSMSNKDTNDVKMKHKEESQSRINRDKKDRESLREALNMYVDPLDPTSHTDGELMNIVTGTIAPPDVNVHQAVKLDRN